MTMIGKWLNEFEYVVNQKAKKVKEEGTKRIRDQGHAGILSLLYFICNNKCYCL